MNMNEIAPRKSVPEPVRHNGRERFVGGWSTAGCAKWLTAKKLGEPVGLGEIASTFYGRDSSTYRQLVKNNTSPLRRTLHDMDEFLLVFYGYRGRLESMKVCNFADENDRNAAAAQLTKLETTGEVTMAEAERWRNMLYLEPYSFAKPEEGGE
jgi:hypothetical protein